MSRYAANTEVSAERSRAEIEETVRRYGAERFMSGWTGQHAVIGFQAHDRLVRFILKLPNQQDKQFTHRLGRSKRWEPRGEAAAYKVWEQSCRQRWRALCLCIKAKLEAVDSQIESFEEAFLGHIVLPGEVTVVDWMVPQIAEAYKTGVMPQMLPMLPAPDKSESILPMQAAR